MKNKKNLSSYFFSLGTSNDKCSGKLLFCKNQAIVQHTCVCTLLHFQILIYAELTGKMNLKVFYFLNFSELCSILWIKYANMFQLKLGIEI